MIILVQRVKRASCKIDDELVSQINQGYLLLVCLEKDDNFDVIKKMVNKILKLRIFSDGNLNIKDVNGEILSISQFTLAANLKKCNRPSFSNAMNAKLASDYYKDFNELLRSEAIVVKEGKFGSDMQIELVNDGPVSIILNSKEFFVIIFINKINKE